jgi:hypothetical protein
VKDGFLQPTVIKAATFGHIPPQEIIRKPRLRALVRAQMHLTARAHGRSLPASRSPQISR